MPYRNFFYYTPTYTFSQTPEDDASSSILQSGRLFLRNLAFACTEEEIQELFAPYGHIAQVRFYSNFNIPRYVVCWDEKLV